MEISLQLLPRNGVSWKRLCNLVQFLDLGKSSVQSLTIVCQSEYISFYLRSLVLGAELLKTEYHIIYTI